MGIEDYKKRSNHVASNEQLVLRVYEKAITVMWAAREKMLEDDGLEFLTDLHLARQLFTELVSCLSGIHNCFIMDFLVLKHITLHPKSSNSSNPTCIGHFFLFLQDNFKIVDIKIFRRVLHFLRNIIDSELCSYSLFFL